MLNFIKSKIKCALIKRETMLVNTSTILMRTIGDEISNNDRLSAKEKADKLSALLKCAEDVISDIKKKKFLTKGGIIRRYVKASL
jgi:hypothetical protein